MAPVPPPRDRGARVDDARRFLAATLTPTADAVAPVVAYADDGWSIISCEPPAATIRRAADIVCTSDNERARGVYMNVGLLREKPRRGRGRAADVVAACLSRVQRRVARTVLR